MDKFIGILLGNRYKIIEKIGDGGMALVYKAKCQLLNRYVAVKILRPEFASEEGFLSKFDKESQAAASLSHPSIVNIFDVGVDGEIHYIVMELVSGITLKQYIKEKVGFLSNAEMFDISKQIAEAIEHAHVNHIIHRDIKPHNILMSDDGRVKVSDFGIARAITSSTIVNTNEIVGSVHYTSPEQARGGFVDERSDIYSIGILMYELAAKRVPFEGDTPISVALKHLKESVVSPSTYNPDINKGFESIILKALQKTPDNRYQSVTELIADLNKVIENPDVNIPFYIDSEDSPTMIMPNILDFDNDEDMMKPTKIRDRSSQDRAKSKKTPKKVDKASAAISVLMALVLAAIVMGLIFYRPMMKNFLNKEIEVPDVTNEDFTAGAKKLQEMGFLVSIEDSVYDDTIEKDHIISQSEAPGKTLKEGFTIKLTVSKGAKMIMTPNVTQKKLVEAQVILENNSLILGDIEYVESDLPNGYVVGQDPAAGVEAKMGSTIKLVVSQGKKSSKVLAPSILGKTVEEATGILEALELKLGTITYNFSSEYDDQDIMVQGVNPGSEISSGSKINVVVSKGPDPQGTTTGEGDSTTGEEGTTGTGEQTTGAQSSDLKVKSYQIPLSGDSDIINVKVVMIQNGVEKVVYEKQHNKSEGNVKFSVYGSGEALLKFYYNGELVHTKDEIFN